MGRGAAGWCRPRVPLRSAGQPKGGGAASARRPCAGGGGLTGGVERRRPRPTPAGQPRRRRRRLLSPAASIRSSSGMVFSALVKVLRWLTDTWAEQMPALKAPCKAAVVRRSVSLCRALALFPSEFYSTLRRCCSATRFLLVCAWCCCDLLVQCPALGKEREAEVVSVGPGCGPGCLHC